MFEVAQNEQGRALDGAAGRSAAARRRGAEPPGARGIDPDRAPAAGRLRRSRRGQRRRTEGRSGHAPVPRRTDSHAPAGEAGVAGSSLAVGQAGTDSRSRHAIERFDRSVGPHAAGRRLLPRADELRRARRAERRAGVEHARAGRFDEAVKALSNGARPLPASFLSGLALYSKGELEAPRQPSSAKRCGSIRSSSPRRSISDPATPPAAATRRRSAAWQLSLVTESDAPFIYTLLGDALLRLRESRSGAGDPERGRERVARQRRSAGPDRRRRSRWPASAADALLKLEPYLEKHPDDHGAPLRRAAHALRGAARPENRSGRRTRTARSSAEWAEAYAAAKGPQQALVEQWRKTVASNWPEARYATRPGTRIPARLQPVGRPPGLTTVTRRGQISPPTDGTVPV